GRVGMARFNAVWSGPDTLPQPAEIEDPQRWIDRIL
ncbi:MAG: zinc-dependent metalloprotease, partial [Mycobacterium sp.]|nr:zinc-dependent metalloprotease [Mycobacterium sp.]